MNFSLYIAKRYLVSKKSHNLINIISLISVIGQVVGTAALIIVLSVFNGFEDVIKNLYNTFNPDFVITAEKGKSFHYSNFPTGEMMSIEGVSGVAQVVEEDALFKYRDNQYIAKIKGVSDNYQNLSQIDSTIVDGSFVLQEGASDFAVIGAGVAWYLDINIHDVRRLLSVYLPKRGNASSFSFNSAFNNKVIHPAGTFSVQQEFDENYVFVPLRFARQLLEYKDEVTSVEIFLKKGIDSDQVQSKIQTILGDTFQIKNRYQQNKTLYKLLRSEKLAIFLILVFILILASFNIVGSLSILIVEKLKDIAILKSMGADKSLIKKIFITEGILISLTGSLIGLIVGFTLLQLQLQFGLIKLGTGEGSFIIDAYPVKILPLDFLYVFITVIIIGYIATWYPVRFLTAKYAEISLK